jgi:hypothetical protein
VGTLDEAFRSRVHISLWYPDLSEPDTVTILLNNLNRLPKYDKKEGKTEGVLSVRQSEIENFIKSEYKRYSRATGKNRGPWNGRQIRNAVQIAACLALYEKETKHEDDGLPAILTADHFRSVADTMSEFESFLKVAKAGDDAMLAKQRQERVDDYAHHDRGDDEDYDQHLDNSLDPKFRAPGSARSNRSYGGPTKPIRRDQDDYDGSWAEEHMASSGAERQTLTLPRRKNTNSQSKSRREQAGLYEESDDDYDDGRNQEHMEEWVPESLQRKSRGPASSPFGKQREGYVWDSKSPTGDGSKFGRKR